MPPFMPTPPAHALAETLLSEWEQRPGANATATSLATRPLTLAQLAPLCELLLTVAEVNVDPSDARTTLAGTTSFAIAAATASGPGRAAQLVAALRFHHHGPAPTGPARNVLLSTTSRADTPLDMDELTFITEAVQDAVGQDAEMIFGHGEYDGLAAPELRLYQLAGYGSPVPAVCAGPTRIISDPLPGPDGRDAAFAEAAHLLVRYQKASGGLLQRELKLGYNRAGRIMQQLQQAGIIGAPKTGQLPPVLIADEAQLVQHLAQLPNYH